jgi:tetratricopeptide (TPR) repeat protein
MLEAIEYHEKSLNIAIEIGDKKGEGNSYTNLGDVYKSLSKYHESIKYEEKGLRIAIEMGDKEVEGSAYIILANAYSILANTTKLVTTIKRA